MNYLLSAEDLKKLRDFSFLRSFEFRRNNFYVKAWVAKIETDFSLACIISESRPEILDKIAIIPKIDRPILSDELEEESRKDTLWGDLKLLGKKSMREVNHHIEHAKIQAEHSVEDKINLNLSLTNTHNVIVGQPIFIRIKSISKGSTISRLAALVTHETFSIKGVIVETAEPINNVFENYVKARRQLRNFLLATFFISTFLIIKNYSPSDADSPATSSILQTDNTVQSNKMQKQISASSKSILSYIENSASNPLGVVQLTGFEKNGEIVLRLVLPKDWRNLSNKSLQTLQFKNICEKWLLLSKELGRTKSILVEEYQYKASYQGVKGKFDNIDYFTVGECISGQVLYVNY